MLNNPPANVGDAGDVGSVPESRGSPGEGNRNPLQYCCLENPMDKGAWRATVQGLKELDMTEATEHTAQTSQRISWDVVTHS